jgi:hypothetical protein
MSGTSFGEQTVNIWFNVPGNVELLWILGRAMIRGS